MKFDYNIECDFTTIYEYLTNFSFHESNISTQEISHLRIKYVINLKFKQHCHKLNSIRLNCKNSGMY